IDVANQKIDVVALDQLARLLHRRTRVTACGIFDQQLDLAPKYPVLAIELVDRELAADLFVLADRRVGSGQRIVEPDLDRLVGEGLDHERAGNLHGADGKAGLEYGSAPNGAAERIVGHRFLPWALIFSGFDIFAAILPLNSSNGICHQKANIPRPRTTKPLAVRGRQPPA